MHRFLIYLLFLSSQIAAFASDTGTQIFDPRFRTLKVVSPYDFYAPPVLRLGSNDALTITIDEMGDDRSYLRWRWVRCEADWSASRLVESQWIDGFNEAEIDDYAYSNGTFIHFVNHRIDLPAEGMTPFLPGNYLLQIYPESEPDRIVAQARIYIEEPLVDVQAKADSYTDRGINTLWQKVDVSLDRGRLEGADPYNDIKIVVEQNSSPLGSVTITHPRRVEQQAVVYEHIPQLIFPALAEYRRFETVRADYPGLNVDSVRFGGSNYHAWLKVDVPLRDREYQYDQTQNGRFMVREYNATDSDLGADYVTVMFNLELPFDPEREVYLDGEFTSSLLDPRFRMSYNSDTGTYQAAVPLKQGSYNYRYLVVDRSGNQIDAAFVDGNHPQTRNEYFVKAYLHDRWLNTDRLLGHTLVMANQ